MSDKTMNETMSETMMNETDFIELIGAYGGKPENWPEDRRTAMQAFCRDNPQADALLSRELMLDGWLDSRLVSMNDALTTRLEADMSASQQNHMTSSPIIAFSAPRPARRHIATAMGALAACFVGGFIAAPIALDLLTGGADLTASLDIISDVFLPTEPL